MIRSVVTATLSLAFIGCSGIFGRSDVVSETERHAVTLVALHPHMRTGRLTSANYIRNGFIPRCSRVEFSRIDETVAEFRVVESGSTHVYTHHNAAGVSFSEHLKKVFGPACDESTLDGLSDERNILGDLLV